MRMIPNPTKIPPERYDHTCGGISMSAVDALRRYVKRSIDSANEPITMKGVLLLLAPTLLPITTGSNGSMQGAKTVRIPARNETSNKVMV
jgi:hypothetical protein